MERPDNVGNREDQSNSNGNEVIQLGGSQIQRNSLDPSWAAKVRYGRDAVVFRSRREKYSTNSGSYSDAAQRSTKYTYRMGISWTHDHQSILQNKEGANYNECYPVLCTHQ
ncbi:hypothetical protein MS3_00001135 [Schistosoma haematobium]|uniref:Uncharacterized protein n=1 Tax=Schistosoma haematobium TaxID=6185 RepID=A0A922S2D5_SCHHA|nr:hypothetical protein MS3_00001135 [Schistosoma haematobium]KAH9590749.1 hypothetical protein MS3_00001135 [Schistosoma haematobium]